MNREFYECSFSSFIMKCVYIPIVILLCIHIYCIPINFGIKHTNILLQLKSSLINFVQKIFYSYFELRNRIVLLCLIANYIMLHISIYTMQIKTP